MPKPSRTSTPTPGSSLPPQEFYDPDFLNTRVILFPNLSYEDLVDHGASNATVPDSKTVDSMLEKLKSLLSVMEKRSTFYDRGMRYLADERKKRGGDYDQVMTDEPEVKKSKNKKKKSDDDKSSPVKDSKAKRRDSASSAGDSDGASANGDADGKSKKKDGSESDSDSESSSEDEGAPKKREMPQAMTFGEDPSTFPDPTIYEILPVNDDMTEDEKKKIYSVAVYPKSDLLDKIAGEPPDKDFTNAKPSSQINFTTFATYIEPYFRGFTEEDLGFLRERGDRSTPFVMPKRGKRGYAEIWAEEDGAMSIDSPQQGREKMAPNAPRGNIELMSDSIGETDSLSIGPLASRLLQALRPTTRVAAAAAAASEEKATNGTTNGDVSMNGDDEQNGEEKPNPLQPATAMPDSSSDAWKKAIHPRLEYAQVDERLRQELRHIGFLPDEGFDLEYDGHYDDEVAGRLRHLQARLKEQILINGARKARLTELVKERMANQEYQTILEDLDSQVQAAYLKRTRTLGKSKKAKRPGGAGGGSHPVGGTARPGIGDLTRTLMERRRRWIDTIGSVFEDENVCKVPRQSDPNSSIFKAADMADLLKREKEQWDEEAEEE
ncbi:Putative Transcriptional regulator Ngg1 [[Torrubiella] hemipterigena]|uniref:Putative Transcriptional regulator Ngg1 n=1 Tax=[Torrubiella] hemipterigena TaxID=1531966 RepID=A0A0A1THU5_9HYPO|nr:Putative Transcriptional regulator Ngg1 [[Torrubiella] hemipterigena]